MVISACLYLGFVLDKRQRARMAELADCRTEEMDLNWWRTNEYGPLDEDLVDG